MQLDYGRQTDLEELFKDYQKETSLYWRNRIEQTMSSILSESKASRQLRDEMIKAFRVNDKCHLEYCWRELRRIKADECNNNIQL